MVLVDLFVTTGTSRSLAFSCLNNTLLLWFRFENCYSSAEPFSEG